MFYGWMDDLKFYCPFSGISVMLSQWKDDNERLYALKPCLRLEKNLPPVSIEPDGCTIFDLTSFLRVSRSYQDAGIVIIRLCVVEPSLQLKRFLPPVWLKSGTARSVDQC